MLAARLLASDHAFVGVGQRVEAGTACVAVSCVALVCLVAEHMFHTAASDGVALRAGKCGPDGPRTENPGRTTRQLWTPSETEVVGSDDGPYGP